MKTLFERQAERRKRRRAQIVTRVLMAVLILVCAFSCFYYLASGEEYTEAEATEIVREETPWISSEIVPEEDVERYEAMLRAESKSVDQRLAEMAAANIQLRVASDTPEEDAADDEFETLCYTVMREGGYTEPDEGIHMMAAGVLNRVDSPLFPNTINEVVFQRGQFESAVDLYKYEPTERVIQICAEEMEHRSNTQVLFWRTGHYHAKTTPIAHIGHHYYSGR